jgi:DNA-binding GntR family transcriptional regulator
VSTFRTPPGGLGEKASGAAARILREAMLTLGAVDEDGPRVVEEHCTFHDTIVEAAGSLRLAQMIRPTTALPTMYRPEPAGRAS